MNNGNTQTDNGFFSQNNLRIPKKIGIIYTDAKREYYPTDEAFIADKDAFEDAARISKYLIQLGAEVVLYPGDKDLPTSLSKDRPDMVFNLVDSVRGSEYLNATIPSLLELLEIPYTGSNMLGQSLSSNRFITMKLYQQNGIPVPNYQLFNNYTDKLDLNLRFPLISKLNETHGSVGINEDSVSENEKQLREKIKFLIKTYDQPVFVEEFIVGDEITAILLEGLNKKVYFANKVFTKKGVKYLLDTFEDKWLKDGYVSYYYRKLDNEYLRELTKRAFEISSLADYAKFDIRTDASGRFYFIDCNSNPAFGPKDLDCAISVILDMYGVQFLEILKRLIANTLKPYLQHRSADNLTASF